MRLGYVQLMLVVTAFVFALVWSAKQSQHALDQDAQWMTRLSAYIVRVGFWSVFLIGFIDATISMLRVEGWLVDLVGPALADQLALAKWRGTYVHFPLIGVAVVIALMSRALNVVWLTLLIVLAEFMIVISRFVFSYEQAFMGDLVRFWYAALFLFASAYTLLVNGHVRVDVLYSNFVLRAKVWVNTLGALLLGIPFCGVILWLGMGTQQSSLIAPLLSFEVSQSSYGMYVKYLMALFMPIFAITMAIQFIAYFFAGIALLQRTRGEEMETGLPPFYAEVAAQDEAFERQQQAKVK